MADYVPAENPVLRRPLRNAPLHTRSEFGLEMARRVFKG